MTGPLRLPVLLVLLGATAVVLLRAGPDAPQRQGMPRASGLDGGERLGRESRSGGPPTVTSAGMLVHLRTLERIARRNGGNRAAGTAGDRESADYISKRMRAAGYRVRLQQVRFPFFSARGEPQLVVAEEEIGGIRTLVYSGVGTAGGPVWGVDVDRRPGDAERDSGCQASDFTGLPEGAVTLLERGTCSLRTKVDNARVAGASAAIVFNDGRAGRTGPFTATLGPASGTIPALSASHAAGRRLVGLAGGRARLTVRAVSETHTTTNVIADSPRGGQEVVIAGAHLDSVPEGPGINDNGSGVAALLEAAEALETDADVRTPQRRLRFAFWGAEELGLIGSSHYVDELSAAERAAVDGYLNLDMVGSGNGGRFYYTGPGAASKRLGSVVRRALLAAGTTAEAMHIGARSDHAAFARAGIPVAGLYSGATEDKSKRQQRAFGGRAGEPFHRCYHSACDTLSSVDPRTLEALGRGAAETLRVLAR